MKKILLCLLFVSMAALCNAQRQEGGKMNPKEKAAILQKLLKLNDAQTVKISGIYQESVDKFEKIKIKERGNNDKMLADVRPLRNETIAKIKGVLEARQAVEYDKLIKQYSTDSFGGWASGQSDGYY